MTAHNDKVEAVAALFLRMSEGAHRPVSKWQANYYAESIVSFMEEKGWLKADASRSVSSPEAAGRSGVWPDFMAPPEYENPAPRWRDAQLPDFHEIWRIARTHGYAVALHGSMRRDCDLIAAPWVDNPSPPGVLIDALCAGLGAKVVGDPERKPHGRIAWNIQIDGWFKMIDISVLPAARSASEDTQPKASNGAGRALYVQHVNNHPSVHSNRFPAWEELSPKQQKEWDAKATPSPQLQKLIEAAEKICAKYPLDYDANELQLVLQNVKKSDK